MSWWGTLAGGAFGFMVGGPLGALLGAALGSNFDKGLNQAGRAQGAPRGDRMRVQTAFFTATFSVMGHVCKADGRVTQDELRVAARIMEEMELSPPQQEAARALFNEGKQPGFDLSAVLFQFRQETGRRSTLRRMFIEILCFAAYGDGELHGAERRLLRRVCEEIDFALDELEAILAAVGAEVHHRAQAQGAAPISLADACSVLGVEQDASVAEIKKAYRRLLSRHHPDKLAAKGLPEEMMKMAGQRTHEIRQAYERLKAHQGF